MSENQPIPNIGFMLINNKFRIAKRIGGGSFGEIYLGVAPDNEKVAVKFERFDSRSPQLRHEYKVYRELRDCYGFCNVYYFGTIDSYSVLVMDLLGLSLEDLFNKCNRQFSLKTVLQIADQLLERIDTLHSRHLIHRDIKPANFVIGLGEKSANIYCVDFGLSKRFRHPKHLQHIPFRDGKNLTGTPRYASINNHLGMEQSRRDDLESIAYVLIYFLKGTLPWQGLKAKHARQKYRLILDKKQSISIAQLCEGVPNAFAEFLAYTRSMKFDAKPDIIYLRKLFRELYRTQGCVDTLGVSKYWDWDDDVVHVPSMASKSADISQRVNENVDSDSVIGNNGEKEEEEEDNNNNNFNSSSKLNPARPSTAGVTKPSADPTSTWAMPRSTSDSAQQKYKRPFTADPSLR